VAYADNLHAELGNMEGNGGPQPPLRVDAALDRIRTWKDRGEKIGFTNGCFDLLHPGHVSLLAYARSTCDRLVVGLNSDASVKRLKGENRPMQNEAARTAVISSLETVDLVVIFDEDTPEELLHKIRPDVLVKGADYTVETVVGAEFVQSYGGTVVLAEIVPGFSTTATIARMNTS
jgi:D-beta-D-heptose 7-phosphate kinase/D-beta-D-heptose 1-phosphate adenosyltransferase